jgi:hypothetical protein
MNHIQSLRKYQQDDNGKMNFFKEGELVLWMLEYMKVKGINFNLPWKGPYRVQFVFNNNTVELSTLSNDDGES